MSVHGELGGYWSLGCMSAPATDSSGTLQVPSADCIEWSSNSASRSSDLLYLADCVMTWCAAFGHEDLVSD